MAADGLRVDYRDIPELCGDRALLAQGAQRPIHMHYRQPEMIRDILLAYGDRPPLGVAETELSEPAVEIHKHRAYALHRTTAPQHHHLLMQSPLVLGELPHEPECDIGIAGSERDCIDAAKDLERAGRQALDAVGLSIEQHRLDGKQIAG